MYKGLTQTKPSKTAKSLQELHKDLTQTNPLKTTKSVQELYKDLTQTNPLKLRVCMVALDTGRDQLSDSAVRPGLIRSFVVGVDE